MVHDIDFLGSYDVESLILELQRIAAVRGKPTVTVSDIEAIGRVSPATVFKRFGTMKNANVTAGLVPRAVRVWSDEELLDMLSDLWRKTTQEDGRRPLKSDVRKHNLPVNASTISERFGTWNKALMAADELDGQRWRTRPPRPAGQRASISLRTRYRILKRDLFRCRLCGKAGVELEIDHVVPLARGGSEDFDNLQALCVPCNRGKSDSLQ